jgi:hypothetical protein
MLVCEYGRDYFSKYFFKYIKIIFLLEGKLIKIFGLKADASSTIIHHISIVKSLEVKSMMKQRS